MAGVLSLKTPSNGLVTLTPTDTATNKDITIPATSGSLVVQDGTSTTTVTNLAYTGTLTGGTGVVNIGSGQIYKDASGNVGIGVTPSAWSGVGPALQIGTSAAIIGNSASSASFLQNAYYNGSAFTYLGTGFATRFQATNGGYSWSTAPSGTAGNAISFTQAMTLTAAGDLQVGTGVNQATLKPKVLMFYNTGASDGLIQSADDSSTFTSMGINKTELKFYTNNSERARIDSSGNLLVGTTSNGNNVKFVVDGASQAGGEFRRNSTGSLSQILFVNPNGVVGQISTSGSSTSFTTSSDYRLKQNVAPMTGALQTVAQLKPVTYTWKADGSAGQGFIAHELQAVVPDCVTGEKDAVAIVDDLDAEGKKIGTKEVPRYQGVDTSFLVATLVAAIQEQQTIIANLTTRLEALEAI